MKLRDVFKIKDKVQRIINNKIVYTGTVIAIFESLNGEQCIAVEGKCGGISVMTQDYNVNSRLKKIHG